MTSNNSTNPHSISLALAVEMTTRFRDNRNSVVKTEYAVSDIMPLCETFDKEAFNSLFTNDSCKKIRIYYGMTSNLQVHAVIVGVDANDADMLPANSTVELAGNANAPVSENDNNEEDDENIIIEESQRCPPSCPPPSPLNEP